MSQKRNKIIIVLTCLVILILVIIFYIKAKQVKNIPLSSTPYQYYKTCASYLGQPQILKNGIAVIPPQVYCKVENNEVKLVKVDETDQLKSSDFIVLAVNTKHLISAENFKALYQDKITSELLPLPTNDFTLCLYYPSYLDEVNFTLFPMEFNYDKLKGTSLIAACSPRKTLFNLEPIGLVGTIPSSAINNTFGITIVLPPSNLYNDSNIKAEAVISNPLFFQKVYGSYISIQK